MSKEKDWVRELCHKWLDEAIETNSIADGLADDFRQELVRRIEGKKKFYCEIHGIKQRRDKCIRCCETFMYREAIDEIIKEIS